MKYFCKQWKTRKIKDPWKFSTIQYCLQYDEVNYFLYNVALGPSFSNGSQRVHSMLSLICFMYRHSSHAHYQKHCHP